VTWKGSITFPSDFDILCSPSSRYPWIATCRGTSMSAAIRSAGQITAWNLRMSLPIRWTFAGQKRSVRSSSRAYESAV
jgi:hypothetical protein